MRLILKSARTTTAEPIGLALLGLALVVGWGWVYVLHLPGPKGVLCSATGWPCPMCGGTRSALLIQQADWLAALMLNPLAVLMILAVAVWCVYALVVTVGGLPRLRIAEVTTTEARAIRLLAWSALLGNWLYVWLMR